MPEEILATGATTPDSSPAPTDAAPPAPETTPSLLTGNPDSAQTETKDEPVADLIPDAYELTLPEGFEPSPEALAEFTPLAKELKLGQEGAQKLVAFAAAQKQAEVLANQQAWDKQQSEWISSLKTDKELGGQNFKATVDLANKALAQNGTPAFFELLKTSGLCNHPEMVRFCAAIGKRSAEDKVLPASSAQSIQKTTAQLLYTNSSMA